MKILVTGSNGFIGKNLIADLKATTNHDILEFDKDTDSRLLNEYAEIADFIFHLAGVNRPETEEEYIQAVQEGVQSLDLNAEDMTYEYYEEED